MDKSSLNLQGKIDKLFSSSVFCVIFPSISPILAKKNVVRGKNVILFTLFSFVPLFLVYQFFPEVSETIYP